MINFKKLKYGDIEQWMELLELTYCTCSSCSGNGKFPDGLICSLCNGCGRIWNRTDVLSERSNPLL